MQQMKEHAKTLQNQTNEEEIRSLPEKELRVMTANMTQKLRNEMQKFCKFNGPNRVFEMIKMCALILFHIVAAN